MFQVSAEARTSLEQCGGAHVAEPSARNILVKFGSLSDVQDLLECTAECSVANSIDEWV